MGYRVIDGKLHIIENFKSADAYSARNSVNTEDKRYIMQEQFSGYTE